jgi:Phosphopantetheine attachment site/AMP-binding enzyme C-terminal domain
MAEVKLRGRLIDPDRVEAALAGHPRIDAAAVAVHGDALDQWLVAYLVGSGGPAGIGTFDLPGVADGPALRAYLAAAVPAEMVPDAFVIVDRVPATPSGEPDRDALARSSRGGGSPAIVAGLAAEVADVWREALGVDAVRLCDSLFDLGGHSMTITRIARQLRATLGVDVPLAVFYDTPTVTGVLAAIEELSGQP